MYEGDAKYGLTYDHTGNRVILHILGVVKTAENSKAQIWALAENRHFL